MARMRLAISGRVSLRVTAETTDPAGHAARVTYEAIVQRTPAPLIPPSAQPDAEPQPNPDEPSEKTADLFGRRLVIVQMREVR